MHLEKYIFCVTYYFKNFPSLSTHLWIWKIPWTNVPSVEEYDDLLFWEKINLLPTIVRHVTNLL